MLLILRAGIQERTVRIGDLVIRMCSRGKGDLPMERTKMQRMGIGLALAALVSTTPVLAQQAIHPTITGETGLFETLSGTTAGPGDWTLGLYLNNFDRVIDFGTGEDSIDIYQLGASVGYGFPEALEMSILLPWQKLDNGPDPDGLANARLGMKYQFSGDDTSGVALNAFVTLPTGDEDVAPDDTGYGVGIAWNDGNWFAGGEYAVLG